MQPVDRTEASIASTIAPHALILGHALRTASPDFVETMLRRMGLQPQRIVDGAEGMAGTAFRLIFGTDTAIIARADEAALAAADPANPTTSSLATALRPDWRTDGAWMVTPGGDGAATRLDASTMREFFKLLVLLIDAFDASHLHWSPARLWSDAPQFREAIAEMLASGMPPVLHLVAFRRREEGGEAMVVTRGLAAFTAQEIEAPVPRGWTMADMVKRLARLAIELMIGGAVRDAQTVPGLTRGEIVRLTPVADGDLPARLRVDFESGA